MEASEHGHTEVVKLLLSKEADPKKVTTVSHLTYERLHRLNDFHNHNHDLTSSVYVLYRIIVPH